MQVELVLLEIFIEITLWELVMLRLEQLSLQLVLVEQQGLGFRLVLELELD
jgi:hypothetical protein